MAFRVTILGSSAAIPTSDRNPTSQIVEIRGHLLMVDCGEGTQMQLRKHGVKIQKINHIFISHLHGDHYYGLIGLLNSLHLLGRTKEIHLYGIKPLKELIDLQLSLSGTVFQYPLRFHEFDTACSSVILDKEGFSVTTIPLDHRIPTCGFFIREKPEKRNIRKEFLKTAQVPVEFFERIKNGEDFIDENGKLYLNRSITLDPPPVRSYAYCSDTAYHEPVINIIRECSLLYHEATFMHDRAEDARAKFHSTAREAATIALKAHAGKLIIGHFSARYDDVNPLLEEARQVFPQTIAAEDGMTVDV